MNLRDFYRCLAEPVLTYRLHKEFIKAASENPERLVLNTAASWPVGVSRPVT